MAKMLRGMDGDYDLAGAKGGGKKKAKKKASKKGKKPKINWSMYKQVSRETCLGQSGKKKNKLKKGCIWGRGPKRQGKLFKKKAA
jgi:hypothetical protein